jgi:hypothetical protein
MRDFFINSLEMLVSVIVVILCLGVLGMAAAMAFGGGGMMGQGGVSGPLAGIAMLIIGGLYVIIVGGFLYLGIGIYQNTKRSAEALEKLLTK